MDGPLNARTGSGIALITVALALLPDGGLRPSVWTGRLRFSRPMPTAMVSSPRRSPRDDSSRSRPVDLSQRDADGMDT